MLTVIVHTEYSYVPGALYAPVFNRTVDVRRLYECLPPDCEAVQFPGVVNFARVDCDEVVPESFADSWFPCE